jgi:Arc/MetJ-type ribon-helix-helix transcriptional regulator
MAKKIMRKSLLEKTEVDKFKTVSARIPQQLSDDFDKLVDRAKASGFVISISKVITAALQDAIEFENIELDKLDQNKQGM